MKLIENIIINIVINKYNSLDKKKSIRKIKLR